MEDTPTILDKARGERERLTNRIGELQAELAELETFIKVYERLEIESMRQRARTAVAVEIMRQRGRATVPSLFESESASAREQTRRAADFFEKTLADGQWRGTQELHDLLMAAQIELTAQNKRQRVAQILSADGRFYSDRSRGWTLKSMKGIGKEEQEANGPGGSPVADDPSPDAEELT